MSSLKTQGICADWPVVRAMAQGVDTTLSVLIAFRHALGDGSSVTKNTPTKHNTDDVRRILIEMLPGNSELAEKLLGDTCKVTLRNLQVLLQYLAVMELDKPHQRFCLWLVMLWSRQWIREHCASVPHAEEAAVNQISIVLRAISPEVSLANNGKHEEEEAAAVALLKVFNFFQ